MKKLFPILFLTACSLPGHTIKIEHLGDKTTAAILKVMENDAELRTLQITDKDKKIAEITIDPAIRMWTGQKYVIIQYNDGAEIFERIGGGKRAE